MWAQMRREAGGLRRAENAVWSRAELVTRGSVELLKDLVEVAREKADRLRVGLLNRSARSTPSASARVSPRTPQGRYSGESLSIHVRKRCTSSAGHGPSQGMLPAASFS